MRAFALTLTLLVGCEAKPSPRAPAPPTGLPTLPASASECIEVVLPAADRKAIAKGWFKRGMRSLEEGDFNDGIPALKRAYCVLPHPSVAYNLGRANALFGDLDEAVRWYRKYLDSHPADETEIERIVQSLMARSETLKRKTKYVGDYPVQ